MLYKYVRDNEIIEVGTYDVCVRAAERDFEKAAWMTMSFSEYCELYITEAKLPCLEAVYAA